MKLTKSFQSLCRVVLFLPKLLLVYPLDYRFKVKKTLHRYSVMIFVLFVLIGFSSIIKVQFYCDVIATSYIENVFNFVMAFTIYLVTGISYYSFLMNLKNIENIYAQIARIEYLFLSEKFKIKYNFKKAVIVDSSICFLAFLYLSIYFKMEALKRSCLLLAVMTCEFLPSLLAYMIGKPLKLFLYLSRQYFGLIWDELVLYGKGGRHNISEKIEHLILLHSYIYNFSKKVNKVYSNYLLGLSMIIFLMISKFMITIIGLLFYGKIDYDLFFGTCFYVLVWIIHFMDIVVMCEKIAKASCAFNLDLHSLFLDDLTGHISDNEQILSHLQKNNFIQFTAAEFFNFDFKLVHTILASTTTYLVLVFQFISLTEIRPVRICQPPNCINDY